MIGEGGENIPTRLLNKAIMFIKTPERNRQFEKLRQRTNEGVYNKTRERIITNPQPTDEEFRLGAFVEELEPQVAYAVREFNRKGYSTSSSGFYGNHGEIQVIDGNFDLDTETIQKLTAIGVKYIKKNSVWGWIQFDPQEPDLGSMKQKWDEIASILPDKGKIAEPSNNNASNEFRRKYVK